MSAEVNEKKTKEQKDSEEKMDQRVRMCCGWFFQLLAWGSLALMCAKISEYGYYVDYGWWLQFILVYIIYFAACVNSNTARYLSNFKEGADIYSYMGSLFYKPAYVDFNIACYHMETRIRRTGRRTTYRREKVYTYRGSETFKFMTWRDISGPFELKTSRFAKNPNKSLVKLKLNIDIEFPDDGTAYDFECQKHYFIEQNKNKDTYYEYSQNTRIDGLEKFNMVSIDGKKRFSVSYELFLVFSILMLVEFYKIYVDIYCTYQIFEIKKLVSTKNNLNQPDNFKSYLRRLPSIKIQDHTTFDDQNKLGEVNVMPDLPDFDEVTKAELMKRASGLRGPGPDIVADTKYVPPPDEGRDKVMDDHDNNLRSPAAASTGMEYNSNTNQLNTNLTVSNPYTANANQYQGNNSNNNAYQSPAIENKTTNAVFSITNADDKAESNSIKSNKSNNKQEDNIMLRVQNEPDTASYGYNSNPVKENTGKNEHEKADSSSVKSNKSENKPENA